MHKSIHGVIIVPFNKGQMNVCFEVGIKKCRLRVCNELATRVFDFKKGRQDSVIWGRTDMMLKTTSLERELSLKIEVTRMAEFIKRLRAWAC